ncbi:MAG: CPBP family intramembrane metalloprotease [Candidatus Bathyarchaeota archaeon]|nr:CPBP family intramembrane metalloprotease [Candidatus Bathyarchaeota archaeon]
MKDLTRLLLLWLILTVTYALVLFAFRDFELMSLVYHIGLLAIAIYFARSGVELGFRRGNRRYGFLLCAGFLAFLVFRTFLYGGFTKFDLKLDLASFTLVFFAPLTEEIFWRGVILQKMLPHRFDAIVAIFANGALFALMHVPRMLFLSESVFYLISTFLFGVLFAGIFYLSKSSVYYSTIAHSLTNVFSALFA